MSNELPAQSSESQREVRERIAFIAYALQANGLKPGTVILNISPGIEGYAPTSSLAGGEVRQIELPDDNYIRIGL